MTSICQFSPFQIVYKGPAVLSLLKVSYFRRHFALQLSFEGSKTLFPAPWPPSGQTQLKTPSSTSVKTRSALLRLSSTFARGFPVHAAP
jgi:hypothetical protein